MAFRTMSSLNLNSAIRFPNGPEASCAAVKRNLDTRSWRSRAALAFSALTKACASCLRASTLGFTQGRMLWLPRGAPAAPRCLGFLTLDGLAKERNRYRERTLEKHRPRATVQSISALLTRGGGLSIPSFIEPFKLEWVAEVAADGVRFFGGSYFMMIGCCPASSKKLRSSVNAHVSTWLAD